MVRNYCKINSFENLEEYLYELFPYYKEMM